MSNSTTLDLRMIAPIYNLGSNSDIANVDIVGDSDGKNVNIRNDENENENDDADDSKASLDVNISDRSHSIGNAGDEMDTLL